MKSRLRTIKESLESFDWNAILQLAYKLKSAESGNEGDGLDSVKKFVRYQPAKLNDGYCTYIADAAESLYDVKVITLDPANLSAEDQAYFKQHHITPREHSWFTQNGKLYDVEARDGVDEIGELPFFTRLFKGKKLVAEDVISAAKYITRKLTRCSTS